MRNRFAEYYELPEERIKEIWENSLIVFDTNVLLNLYRYNEDARREDILRKNVAAYTTLGDKLTEQLVKAVSRLEEVHSRHPYINIKDIRSKVEKIDDVVLNDNE